MTETASQTKKRNGFTYALAGLIVLAGALNTLSLRFNITVNQTESLGYDVFLTDRGTMPSHRGEFVKFNLPTNKYFGPSHWTKRIAGVPGDKITVVDRTVYINGEPVGYAKAQSATKKRYFPIDAGIIPKGFYYLQADHLDSYDSRYQSFGLVHESTFIGREYPLF